jgi:uncharacterized cupin superfamily protein
MKENDMAKQRRHANLVNVDELEGHPMEVGSKMGASRMRNLGRATGARTTGCTCYDVAPGRAAFPQHWHCIVEETIFVLEGEGTLRIGGDTLPVRAGDYATFPVGPQAAHQLRNTGSGVLRYLCFSNMSHADIVSYPDSKKIGAMAMGPDAASTANTQPWVRIMIREGSDVGYFEGEDIGEPKR